MGVISSSYFCVDCFISIREIFQDCSFCCGCFLRCIPNTFLFACQKNWAIEISLNQDTERNNNKKKSKTHTSPHPQESDDATCTCMSCNKYLCLAKNKLSSLVQTQQPPVDSDTVSTVECKGIFFDVWLQSKIQHIRTLHSLLPSPFFTQISMHR